MGRHWRSHFFLCEKLSPDERNSAEAEEIHCKDVNQLSLVFTGCSAKSGSVFRTFKESLDHFSINKVTVELI